MEHFKKHFLMYTVLPLVILAVTASYYRFMVSYDYEVTFEGYCDPYTESCFVYCEDDECSDPFYYAWQHRDAAALRESCGESSILDCTAAETCLPGEGSRCFVQYCEPEQDEDCESLTGADKPFEEQINELISNPGV